MEIGADTLSFDRRRVDSTAQPRPSLDRRGTRVLAGLDSGSGAPTIPVVGVAAPRVIQIGVWGGSVPKTVPPCLTALGRRQLPEMVVVGDGAYALKKVFKNDFFAITGMYERPHAATEQVLPARVLLKINRQAWLGPLPMKWAGRILANKEVSALTRLSDVGGVPRLLCRWGPTGIIREYIEGSPIRKGEPVGDDFHRRLASLIGEIHRRGMAYVDLEKCENVLVGADGLPYLFDFQISWYVPRRWGGDLWPLTVLRRWFQEGDRYHLLKLQRRTRGDQLDRQTLLASYRRPWYVRVHRFLTVPFTRCRRRILERVDPRRRDGERGRLDEDIMGVTRRCR